jgi:hypothetical protein
MIDHLNHPGGGQNCDCYQYVKLCPLYDQLMGKLPVFLIGDTKKVGKAQDTMRDVFITA